ncbi:hypothetical protein Tco_0476346 [Tanacetum coccineum]
MEGHGQRSPFQLVSTTTWFKPIPESERPATPEPEWTIPPNDFPEPEHNWANAYATTYQVPEENKLQRKRDLGLSAEQVTKMQKICLIHIKAQSARYLDFGLEELVPSLWVESEREYDISAVYGSLTGVLGIESYQTKINLERPNWDAADYYFKEDYTIVPKPRAVVSIVTEMIKEKAWKLGSGQRMDKREAKDFILQSEEKTTDQKDLSKS